MLGADVPNVRARCFSNIHDGMRNREMGREIRRRERILGRAATPHFEFWFDAVSAPTARTSPQAFVATSTGTLLMLK